jgi:outer membrane protein assembly factor BamB
MIQTRNTTLLLLTLTLAIPARADDWPQWMGPKRDGVWRETGILQKFPAAGPKIRWRVPCGGGYASPTIANGKVYVTDRQISPTTSKPANAFARITQPGVERVLCLDEATGKTLWFEEYPCDYTMSYNAGPRAAPAVDGDKLYTFGGEGDLQCRNANTGKLIWEKHLGGDKTPMWGFSSSPLIDGDKLIVFGADSKGIAMAFNKLTGVLLWQALPAKEPGYCSPLIIEAGGKRQLIVWHPESLNSLDPETGKVYWSEPFESRSGMSIAMPVHNGDQLFITAFFSGAMMMQLDPDKPAAKKLWKIAGRSEKNTAALHSTISTPVIKDDHIYGVCSYGQLRCLKAKTGDRIWETFAPTTGDAGKVRWANAFIDPHEDRYFLFNESGDLIIANLTPKGYEEISRAHLLEPTNLDANRLVVWTQPAFANRNVYVRNDKEIVCASLAE